MTGEDGVNRDVMNGHIKYGLFAEAVRTKLRYFRDSIGNDVLNTVLATCRDRQLTIPRGDVYWRAQIGCRKELETRGDGDFSWEQEKYRPYDQDRMKPKPNWRSEGRVNPPGMPYLYLASTRDTALAEVRPWIGSILSVAQFKIERALNVIDCAKHHSKKTLRTLVREKTCCSDGMWIAIDQAFATPVTRDEEGGEYIATQVIAELFKSNGFDGIRFKSLLSEDGYNLALFNLDNAGLLGQTTLYTTASINFRFKLYGTEDIGHGEDRSG